MTATLKDVLAVVGRATEGEWQVEPEGMGHCGGTATEGVFECWIRHNNIGQANAAAIVASVNWLRENGEALERLVEAARKAEALIAMLIRDGLLEEQSDHDTRDELRAALAAFPGESK